MNEGDAVIDIVDVEDVVEDAFGDSERSVVRVIVPDEEIVIDTEKVSLTLVLIIAVIDTEGVNEVTIVRVFSGVNVIVTKGEVDGAVEIVATRVEDAETDADIDITELSVPHEDEDNDMLWQVV